MKISHLIPERGTPADLFLSRYQWLSRWAMQFARNDRSAAEDLIQDTYLRFSQANLRVEDIRDPEALLYTYLEYVHLAHLRQFARHSFTSLAEAKLDALALGLPSGPDVDRIETQNTLRHIAAFIAWRKKTSKSASIVALRFFHGYLPEEIARIALVSRQAVDERLHNGRSEVRLHLLDPEKLRRLQHGGPPEIFPAKFVIPTDELLGELHGQLFSVRHGNCLSAQQMAALYRKSTPVPMPRDLLAHIVSCRSCLAVVEQNFRLDQRPGNPTGGSGSEGGMFAMKRRGPQSERPGLSAKDIGNVIRRSERRQKEIFEHRPSSLIVAVNGEIIASRDTAASLNGLKVETTTRDLKFIEVLNEYGVSLLSWVVESPPYGDPVVHLGAQFSMGRLLEVDLQFSAQKLVIEVQYLDSSYATASSLFDAALGCALDEEDAKPHGIDARPNPVGLAGLWQTLLKRRPEIRFTPSSATAFVCTIVLTIFAVLWFQRPAPMKPAEFLQHAAFNENQTTESGKSSVILQQVSIRTSQGTIERSIYREAKGRHHQKPPSLDEAKTRLKTQLNHAGIDWDAPLSVASFQNWHAHCHIRNESVQRTPGELLTLRVDVEGSDVEQETITVRAGDFHPIGKTIEFRDLGTVEIAEVNYAIVPWETINPNLFESEGSTVYPAMAPLPSRLPQSSRQQLSSEELDMAELQVKTILHEVHADFNDRLSISRTSTGVQVRGLIEEESQRSDLKRQLNLIPHVSSDLASVRDAPRSTPAVPFLPGIQAISVVAEPSLLEAYLLKSGTRLEVSSHVAEQLFVASASLLHANKALSQLKEQYPSDKLSPHALDLYNRLLESWRQQLDAAIVQESKAIEQTGVQASPEGAGEPTSASIDGEVQTNRTLLQELIGHNESNARAAPVVIAELARSIGSLRKGLLNERSQLSPGTYAAPPPASKNQP